jgi:hypothetical protein
MKIHVCKAENIEGTSRSIPDWSIAEQQGHQINTFNGKPDAIVGMSISQMDKTIAAIERWPSVPLFCYNWDCYEWVWLSPRPGEYDYRKYGELLKKAAEIWVPSVCTGKRTTQWWGLKNWHVILSSCPWWDYNDTTDRGYALCCLREIPDPWWSKFEQACKELNIPYRMTRHEQSYEEYQDAVAHCRFLCAPLFELSTGGLSLMEGYYLGKPVLINDSEWNGGRDYFRDRALYFKHGNFVNFKNMLMVISNQTSANRYLTVDHKKYITQNFSDARIVDDMLRRINAQSSHSNFKTARNR